MIFYIIVFLSCLILYGVLLSLPNRPKVDTEQETEFNTDWDYMHPEKYIH